MLEVIGEEGTSEYEAALSIAAAFEGMWRGCTQSRASLDEIRIAANVKISGYQVSDIDLVIFGRFGRARKFLPTYAVHDSQGRLVRNRPVSVENFVIAVEVKDHSESGVHLSGDRIDVRYTRAGSHRWHSATDQNVSQVHALRAYLQDHDLLAYVHRCLLMRGLARLQCPGAVCAGFDGPELLTAVAAVSRVRQVQSGFALSSSDKANAGRIGALPIFKKLVPTALDRAKMDAIVKRTPESEAVLKSLCQQLVVLRGRGGTGKTIMLLQAAWHAFEARSLRTLVLTYNHALAADIRRLLALLRVPAEPEQGGIAVETVMRFMTRWFRELGVVNESGEAAEDQYLNSCATVNELISGGAVRDDDIERIIAEAPGAYLFDVIVVDEAQDWPQSEADLLKKLYSPHVLALADGVDQLVRGDRTNWLGDIDKDQYRLVSLERCLRMKRNLASFANEIGESSGTTWQVLPNDAAGGGRIIILQRPYSSYAALHGELLSAAKASGNSELDFLFCVPSSSVTRDGNNRFSEISGFLKGLGCDVWDGVDPDQRRDFPRASSQFRVVQYASCRGLEGWTVVLEGLDEYWEECCYWRRQQGLTETERMAFRDLEELARSAAWLRVLIAVTRPIDTLVITLSDLSSVCSKELTRIASEFPDFVEILP